MKSYLIVTLFAIMIMGYSCSKEGRLDHIDENAPAPAQITDIQTKGTEGGAIITYKIPKDPNLAYVKAIYDIQPGVTREARSSVYSDTLALVGFGDTLTHEVKLFSVGKNEKASDPVSITVKPLTPPVVSIFKTVEIISAFGGVTVSFTNTTRANIAVELMVDTTGKNTWSSLNTYYTAAPNGKFSVRGMQSVEKRFAVLVRDRWNNKSDTLIKNLTPKFEIEIPKNDWKDANLKTDIPNLTTYYKTKLWDGKWDVLGSNCFASPNGSPIPQWFTIDLGHKVQISRFKEHQAPTSHLYIGSAVKRFELWGSNNPASDGSFDNWVLLGTFESYKPSGLPLGQTTAEDKNYGNFLGEDFEFTDQPAAYRFIRFKTLETYSSTGQVVIGELTLFGEIQD
ncbi:DUF5126 domain-containing protein [Pedobacter sp. BS3]|uniref:DUF5000 domain-containing lipoprotein n=1 Tax=Pedobacter sp. BS3 TaxID=2567937 RepID=UPI0011EC0101|nr:DUF5000 domain-containing lipoprotein [Pedobacter sp. BS3]TZF82805.1 DUF5126 domain-containing protein [Pedobacter sp. BS3]